MIKKIAPSIGLRKWFDHDPEKFKDFSKKYTHELAHNPELVSELKQYLKKRKTTLVYGAKDPIYNHAVFLQNFLTCANQ